jgi:ribosomal protein L24
MYVSLRNKFRKLKNEPEKGNVIEAEAKISNANMPNVLSISVFLILYLVIAIKAKNGVATPIQYKGDNNGDVSFRK